MSNLPATVRGPAAFVLVLLIGAGLLWRYQPLVDRSIEASIDRPVASLGYGIAAHLTIIFFGLYATSQLSQISLSGYTAASIGLLASIAVLAVVAALGFTVVGAAIVEFKWGHHPWYGLLLGAFTAGLAGLADPLIAVMVWLVIVSTGVGGPVRRWFNSAEDVQSAR